MLVDAISDKARLFYLRFGFEQSPVHPVQLLYDLHVAASAGEDLCRKGAQVGTGLHQGYLGMTQQ